MEAFGVQKQTTPLKPQRVDMLSYLHLNINMQKKNPNNNNKYLSYFLLSYFCMSKLF